MITQLEALAVTIDDHVAQVTLLGPGKGNTMGDAFFAELPQVFNALDTDPNVRAIVLTGSQQNFSYGLDLSGSQSNDTMLTEGATALQRTRFHQHLRRLQAAIDAVADARVPTISAINGWCVGGGVDLIAATDIRYASANAKFSVREVRVAIVADLGSLARLPLILSDGHLRELALTGRDIDARHAERIGLVNTVFDDAESTLAAAHATAREIAANPPLTVRGVKDVLDQQRTAQVATSQRYVAAWNAAFLPSKDLTEGVSAALQKRIPHFTGE